MTERSPSIAVTRMLCAFTLLEMILAISLASVLMIGVMSVIQGLGRSLNIEQSAQYDWIDQCLGCVERDLRMATQINEASPRGVSILGVAALDIDDSRLSHQPVMIRYYIDTIADRPVLIREQTLLNRSSGRVLRREIMAVGITRFEVLRLDGVNNAPSSHENDATPLGADAHRWLALPQPPRFTIVLSVGEENSLTRQETVDVW